MYNRRRTEMMKARYPKGTRICLDRMENDLSENYSVDCMHKRNRHLVNFSGYCVAYLNKNSGGTAFTVNYARQNGLEIFNLSNLK